MANVTEEDMAALLDMFGEEDLNPELIPFIDEGRTFGKCLHHPLIVEVLYRPEFHKRYNRMYALKKEEVETALRERNWAKYIFLHERPYRLDALTTVLYEHDVPQETMWPLIAHVWTDSENIRQNLDEWRDIWDGSERRREEAMDDDEQAALKALPDEIIIYRGFAHVGAEFGISWTTDRNRAIWFAKRFEHADGFRPMLATGRVNKADVLAYFLGRNESEIVVMPECVENLEITNLVDEISESV